MAENLIIIWGEKCQSLKTPKYGTEYSREIQLIYCAGLNPLHINNETHESCNNKTVPHEESELYE